MKTSDWIWLGIVGVGIALFLSKKSEGQLPSQPDKPPLSPSPILCTADVKQCSDGSWVSRKPPSCEFAECPPYTTSSLPLPPTDQGIIVYSIPSDAPVVIDRDRSVIYRTPVTIPLSIGHHTIGVQGEGGYQSVFLEIDVVANTYTTYTATLPPVDPLPPPPDVFVPPPTHAEIVQERLLAFYDATMPACGSRMEYIHITLGAKLNEFGFTGNAGDKELELRRIYTNVLCT